MGCSSSKDPPTAQGNQESNTQRTDENEDGNSLALDNPEELPPTQSPERSAVDLETTGSHSPTGDAEAEPQLIVDVTKTTGNSNEESQLFDEEWRKYLEDQKRELLLEELRVAIERRDRQALEHILPQCQEKSDLKSHKEVIRGQKILDRLIARDDLREAVQKRSVEDIEEQLKNIKSKGYSKTLQQDVLEANTVLEMLWREASSDEVVIPLDKKTMSEIRRYQSPPAMMHRVIQAALLLLGEDELTTQEWSSCQRLMNPQGNLGLSRKFYSFSINDVHPEICARAKYILLEEIFDTRTGQPVVVKSNPKKKNKQEEEVSEEDKKKYWRTYDLATLQKVSPTAVPFYVWCMGVIDDYSETYGSDFEQVIPARTPRQKEIFQDYKSFKTQAEPPEKRGKHDHPLQGSNYSSTPNIDYGDFDREN